MTLRPPTWLLAWLLLVLATGVAHAQTAPITIDHAEAVPASWSSSAPPATGWTPVKLLDDWSMRWPHHDGVVWYRLRWNQADAAQPVGLLVNQVTLADAVYVNGSLIHRDPHLVEPLSRSWIAPQYFLLDKPLLRAGTNILLVRVSGLAAYQPGLGAVTVGDPHLVFGQFRSGWRLRYQFRLYNQAIYLALAGVFLMLWLFRRQETVYGWFALSTLLIAAWDWNNVAPSPWPFASTDAFQSWNMVFYIAASTTLAIFLLRFCGRRWPRAESMLWLYVLGTATFALLAPHLLGEYRFELALAAIALYYAVPLVFIVHTARNRQPDRIALAICLLIPLLVNVHDILRFFEIIHDKSYVSSLTSPLMLVGMGFVMAYRYSAAMRRAEGFNLELKHEVDSATAKLADTLTREHALALAHTRVGERLNLVRDLHDGFGGSLLGAIATLEQAPSSPENRHAIATLKELRDDLRMVIDTTTHEQDADLAGLLAPLRHRWSQRLEAVGIDNHWHLGHLDSLHLGPARSLDLLRFLQEALTNVLKHSGASRVNIHIIHDSSQLQLEVRDNGRGFDPVSCASGAGLASLRARANRLGGKLTVQTTPGDGTDLRLDTAL